MATWSPTSLFDRRAYSPEFESHPQKDFCNTFSPVSGRGRAAKGRRGAVIIGVSPPNADWHIDVDYRANPDIGLRLAGVRQTEFRLVCFDHY
jgi:hypothetical protein